ncbi:uncharacterized protein LOC122549862 isoform X1 [Chiloscyllium plagiosum]|uniref:uncharacterized protein LOC122549862 isoform X1 n=2 Tax=Chiloscyllium plagiosum TaxID=36176 RepID=UPI001CB7BECF|nr:uncharacterized protein LOC122549862 isoform X1 [Chiloscyllium plagiosum]XP_043545954.1 uncharacterized protein LOC122549862 isoform X1 [Chiloscyllium plagiosum]
MMGDVNRRQDRANRELKNMVSANVFYCKICDVRCTSEMNLKMHFLGLKHKKNEGSFKNVPGTKGQFKNAGAKTFNTVKKRVPTIDSPHAYGSSLLEQHIRDVGINDPLIGLKYVIEYQTAQSPDPTFFCGLCNCRGGFSSFMSHLLGYKHRLNYMGRAYPDALQLDGVKLKQSELNALVKEKAEFIEKIDGRGSVKVVLDDTPVEFSGGNSGKRVPDNYGQSQHDNFGSSFNHFNLESPSVYDPRWIRSQDGQSDKYSRHENFRSSFGQPDNMGNSSSYESRMPPCHDYRSAGEMLHDDWRKHVKSEDDFMDWSEDMRNSGDNYRRGEPLRNYRNDYSKGSDVDDRWMQSDFEPYRSSDSKLAYTNEDFFEYLQNFQITSDSDASFALKVTQSLTDGLMEYRLKTMTGLNQDKRPFLDEELRHLPSISDEHSRYESPMSHSTLSRPALSDPAPGNTQRYAGSSTNFRPKYKVGGAWKKAVAMQSKANFKKTGFQSNRRPLKPSTFHTSLSKSKHGGILTPHLLKAVRGMDINRATKTLAKLSKTNPALKGVKVSVLVNVLIEAGVLKNMQT